FDLAEAILRVFQRLGDYKHKQRNRMKFMIREIGFAKWRELVADERRSISEAGGTALPFDPQAPPAETPPRWAREAPDPVAHVARRALGSPLHGPGLHPTVRPLPLLEPAWERWRATNVRLQKQAGFAVATVTLPLGDLTGEQMRLLGNLAAAF